MTSQQKIFFRTAVIFLAVFALCYYGIKLLTGLATPEGYHSAFVEHYLDISSWMRTALMKSSEWLLSVFGTASYRADEYILRTVSGAGIRLVYSCLGFGVMSFWTAYIFSSGISVKKKMIWLFAGLSFLFLLNVIRLSLVLKATEKGWHFPFGWDHHTWFNIIAYLFMFIMIFVFFSKTAADERS